MTGISQIEASKELVAAIRDNKALQDYVSSLREFNEDFCNNMFNGKDFTLKLEVHGDKGKINHCRVSNDRFARPSGKTRK